jgi:hypothetical protein
VVMAEVLAARARAAGLVLLVDADGRIQMYPAKNMPPDLLRLCLLHYGVLREWLTLDASLQLSTSRGG